jgi:hypothetical protein
MKESSAMTWEKMWLGVRRGYLCVNAYLEAFYRHGPAAHGVQGVVREFLEGPPEGVHLSWVNGQHGPICQARDARGTYRIELHRQDGRWRAHGCSCLGFQEFQRECRHLRAARQELVSRDGDLLAQAP